MSALSVAIAAAEVLHVRQAMAQPAGPAHALNRWREALFLKLTAVDGTVGWGETYALPGTRAILEQQANALVGRSVSSVGGWPPPLGIDEVGGSLVLGAIDIAVHDLAGRLLGVPVSELLGVRRRSTVPVYASAFLYREGPEPAAHWVDEAQRLDAEGYRAMKVRLGGLPVADELARLEVIRHRLPAATTLMVDAWGAYTPSTAVRVGDELHRLGVSWFEEPCPPGPEYAGYEHLTRTMPIPVAGGEAARSRASLKQLLDRRAFDVIQPDIAICGGLRTTLFVAELAALHGTACVPHTWNGGVMAAATMQLLAVLPPTGRVADDGGTWLEYDATDNAFIRGALCDPPELVDGCFAVPDGPGLGFSVDEPFLRAHLVDD